MQFASERLDFGVDSGACGFLAVSLVLFKFGKGVFD